MVAGLLRLSPNSQDFIAFGVLSSRPRAWRSRVSGRVLLVVLGFSTWALNPTRSDVLSLRGSGCNIGALMITYTILVVPCYRYNIIYPQTPILIIKAPIHHSTLIQPLSRTPLKDPLKGTLYSNFSGPFW